MKDITVIGIIILSFIGGVWAGWEKCKSSMANSVIDIMYEQVLTNQGILKKIDTAKDKNEKCKSILNADITDCLR